MIFLGFVFASLVAVNGYAQLNDHRGMPEWNAGRPSKPPNNPKSNTMIENKNVNIVVNVDPKEVAKELFTLIQGRVDGKQTRRFDDTRQTINDLEKIISPMVAPSRRSNRPTAFEIAYALDHITRRALLSDHLTRPTIDDEINTRDVVARMMTKLKTITDTNEARVDKSDHSLPAFRRMQDTKEDQHKDNDSKYSDDDQYINVNLKIRKSELLRRSTSPDIES